jgi:co-chaperonin GroES (HSP10)
VNIKPLSGRLVIRPDDAPKKRGAIHLPTAVKQDHETGVLVAVPDDESVLTVGDRVLYSATRGFPFEYDGEWFLGMLRGDLLARIES